MVLQADKLSKAAAATHITFFIDLYLVIYKNEAISAY